MTERLQKVLAHAGVASRRAAERMIRERRVRVNGAVVLEMGTQVDPARDAIEVDGRPRKRPRDPDRHLYVALNKPLGVVSTVSDPRRRRRLSSWSPHRGACIPSDASTSIPKAWCC